MLPKYYVDNEFIVPMQDHILSKMHMEVVKEQRWDLTPKTRAVLYICLN